MTVKYLLDTHTWVWWHTTPRMLSRKVSQLITLPADDDELLLSTISLWEFCKLVELGRMRLKIDGRSWLAHATNMAKLRIVPISPEIAWASTTLPGKFHRDPADQIIVATAREESATIVTRDHLIADYIHVRSLW